MTASTDILSTTVTDRGVRVVARDWTATFHFRHEPKPWADRRSYESKTRFYGAVNVFAAAENARYDEAARVQPNVKHTKLRHAVIKTAGVAVRAALPALVSITDQAHLFDAYNVNFSQYAGCTSCPCSPGFIGSTALTIGGRYVDVWFD